MSIADVTKKLRAQQQEVLSAIEARKGQHGAKYVALVKESAQSCAVLKASQKTMPEFDKVLRHCCTCVLAVGMQKTMQLYGLEEPDDILAQEFANDVVAVTRFMLHKCTPEELQ